MRLFYEAWILRVLPVLSLQGLALKFHASYLFSFGSILSVLDARASFLWLILLLLLWFVGFFFVPSFLVFLLRVVCFFVWTVASWPHLSKHQKEELQYLSSSLNRMVKVEWSRSSWEQICHFQKKTFINNTPFYSIVYRTLMFFEGNLCELYLIYASLDIKYRHNFESIYWN